jgi:hypothetical protein
MLTTIKFHSRMRMLQIKYKVPPKVSRNTFKGSMANVVAKAPAIVAKQAVHLSRLSNKFSTVFFCDDHTTFDWQILDSSK